MTKPYFWRMSLLSAQTLYRDLIKNFPFQPTADQEKALAQISRFCLDLRARQIFLLKGYAGTGKTTLINALVKTMPAYKRKTVLLAPTGRAAKVMSQYSGKAAFTIHKYIYRPRQDKGGTTLFNLRENKASNTLYIIDEASMISDLSGDFSDSLLQDLLRFTAEGVNCKLLMVGDTAQLPPIHTELSPALDKAYLELNYHHEVEQLELQEVMRQEKDSVLLENATALRQMQADNQLEVPKLRQGPDVIRLMEGFEVEEAMNNSFSDVGREGTAIVVRSNKRAGMYNRQIRQRILWQEDEISTGDFLMVVKNNYFWLPEKSRANFIANGDIIELLELYEIKELYGYRFARVKVRLIDYPEEPAFETMIFLDVLDMPTASLSWEESKQFYQTVLQDYADIPSKYKRHQEVRQNPYFNALQVKFSYAITCHKSQGGQWENVFVEKPWLPDANIPLDYLRWLYTAFTRAKQRLYLIGFPDEYFK